MSDACVFYFCLQRWEREDGILFKCLIFVKTLSPLSLARARCSRDMTLQYRNSRNCQGDKKLTTQFFSSRRSSRSVIFSRYIVTRRTNITRYIVSDIVDEARAHVKTPAGITLATSGRLVRQEYRFSVCRFIDRNFRVRFMPLRSTYKYRS